MAKRNDAQRKSHRLAGLIGESVWTAVLERMDDLLTEYASELLKRLRVAIEAEPRHSADARVVSLADLCGAIQLIQAGEADFRDVERLDWLVRQHPPGATVSTWINDAHRVTGHGSRGSLDAAMMRSNVK